MICPRFVARELTALADGGGPGMVDQEVPHALCPGRRGANDEGSRGIDASYQWTTHLAGGGGHSGLAAPHRAALARALSPARLRRAVGSSAAAALAPLRPRGGGRPDHAP